MSSALFSASHGLPIDETVPLAMEVSGLKKASILQGRRRIRFQAQTGVTAGPGAIIQFVLADSTGLIDVNSATLGFTYAVADATGTTIVMDDGAAMFRRAQTSINGQLLEDVDNCHRAFNAELYASTGMDFYRTEGSFLNFWKFNKDLVGNAVPYTTNAGPPVSVNGADRRWNDVVSTLTEVSLQHKAGVQMALPLGLLMPAWRCNKYWPLRNMGELVVQLTTAQVNEALWYSGGVAPTNPSYTLSDIFLEVDVVVPHPAYAALLDKVVQMEGEPGLVIPVETRLVTQGQAIQTGNAESAIIVSRATNNLRRVVSLLQPTAGISATTFPSISCFGDNGFQSVQYRCGSLYFPSQPLNSHARAAMATFAAYGEPAQTDKKCVFNTKTFSQTTNSAGTAVTATLPTLPAGTLNGTQSASVAGTASARDIFADMKILGYCFDSYKGTTDPLDYDGISVLGQAGSQLVTNIRINPSESVTPTTILDATRYIHLKNGTLDIKGA